MVNLFVKKLRIAKVYREGAVLKMSDARHYPWYDVSSGFVFRSAGYGDANAITTSASRLAFKNREHVLDMVKKFRDVEKGFIMG